MKVIIENKELSKDVIQTTLFIDKDSMFKEITLKELSENEFNDLKLISLCLFNSIYAFEVDKQTKSDIFKFEIQNPEIANLVKSKIIKYVLMDDDRNGSRFVMDNYHFRDHRDIIIEFTDGYYIAHNYSPYSSNFPLKKHKTIMGAIKMIKKYLNE